MKCLVFSHFTSHFNPNPRGMPAKLYSTGLVGLFNSTTVGFLNTMLRYPMLDFILFDQEKVPNAGIWFKKPTLHEGAGKGEGLLGPTYGLVEVVPPHSFALRRREGLPPWLASRVEWYRSFLFLKTHCDKSIWRPGNILCYSWEHYQR